MDVDGVLTETEMEMETKTGKKGGGGGYAAFGGTRLWGLGGCYVVQCKEGVVGCFGCVVCLRKKGKREGEMGVV